MADEKTVSVEDQLTAALLEIECLKSERKETENELLSVYQVNEELKAEIEKATSGKQPTAGGQPFQTQSFELDGEKYGFQFGATMYKGQKITPVEIMADENLQKELIAINAGIIKKLI
jgi:hypothetical protein